MADIGLKRKAIEGLAQVHTAMKNDQQNAPADPTITNAIETLYLHLLDTVRQDAPLVFAKLEKNAQLGENILSQTQDEAIYAARLRDMLLALDIKSISFDRDPEKEELRIFVNLIAKNRKAVQEEVELPKLELEGRTEQVQRDNKEDVTPEMDRKVVSETHTADSQISESIAEMEKVFIRLNALEGAVEAIPSEEKMDMIRKSLRQAAEWVEKETTCTPEYQVICNRLQTLLQELIINGFFAEASPVVEAFNKINNGTLKKDDKVKAVAAEVLQNLASDNNINLLFKEINLNERNKKMEACQIFAGFGDIVINKLLSALRNASDSKARISIIHIIEEMGATAIPAIKASINMSAPWYYLRNMAYVLGRIGNETSADILKHLLLHKEKRVRKEAFKSIGQTGGNMRGPLLLSVLPQADQELRVNIIEMLGKIKYADAVTDLQDMLKSKSSMAKDEQIAMQEKICTALGAIGSPEAIKTLSEVAESKSFLGIQSYPTEVKYAAKRVLSYIRKK
ncbi:MAG: HEAT repeat domain-containing protein [Deltaproteobacteria bacterium]|nr:HEAT repeat domain-containing protein [Deltaproteobacteria bacterium]